MCFMALGMVKGHPPCRPCFGASLTPKPLSTMGNQGQPRHPTESAASRRQTAFFEGKVSTNVPSEIDTEKGTQYVLRNHCIYNHLHM